MRVLATFLLVGVAALQWGCHGSSSASGEPADGDSGTVAAGIVLPQHTPDGTETGTSNQTPATGSGRLADDADAAPDSGAQVGEADVPPTTPPPANQPVAAAPLPAFIPTMHRILDNVTVSSSQFATQQTPIDSLAGAVVTANIEPGDDGDGPGQELHTVVRRGDRSDEGEWVWTRSTIDEKTNYDKWHSPPAVGIDGRGTIHVAYNMHNYPWQYGTFAESASLENFKFRGQRVSETDRQRHVAENWTGFYGPGTADIPSNQITYPAFKRDRKGVLYVSFRHAVRPALDFEQRMMSSGLARYDVDSEQWTSLGGAYERDAADVETGGAPPGSVVVFAGRVGWTAYPPSLEFDSSNRAIATWFWRSGTAGPTLEHPCVVRVESDDKARFLDGTSSEFPILPEGCVERPIIDSGSYMTISDTAIDSSDQLHLALTPEGGSPLLLTWTGSTWQSETLPDQAGEIFFDADDNLWAIARGPSAWRRSKGETEFEQILTASEGQGCLPRAVVSDDGRDAFVHTRGCRSDSLAIDHIRLLR